MDGVRLHSGQGASRCHWAGPGGTRLGREGEREEREEKKSGKKRNICRPSVRSFVHPGLGLGGSSSSSTCKQQQAKCSIQHG